MIGVSECQAVGLQMGAPAGKQLGPGSPLTSRPNLVGRDGDHIRLWG